MGITMDDDDMGYLYYQLETEQREFEEMFLKNEILKGNSDAQ